jgi:undecaprenyl-diphosphatase
VPDGPAPLDVDAGAGKVVERRWLDAAVAGGALVVLVLAAAVASTGRVPRWEREIFFAINGMPDAVVVVAYPFQLLGVLVVPAIAAVAVVIAKRWWRAALALLLLIPLKLVVELQILKRLVDRERPAASICGGDLACGEFRNVPLAFDSFPSGHAVIIGGMLAILAPYVGRRGRVVLVVMLAGVMLARVFLGAHNPLDVVGGAAAGIAIGSLLNLAVGIRR